LKENVSLIAEKGNMSLTDVYDYTDKLKELLKNDGKVVDISLQFKKITENSERVKFLKNLLCDYKLIGDGGRLKLGKTSVIAESCRTKGNQFYAKKQFVDALQSYNQSLCFAESSNIGISYANRSAVFYELKLFDKCLRNIELAKQNGYPVENYEKLDKRKELCEEAIGRQAKQTSGEALGSEFLKLNHKANEKLPFLAECLEVRSSEQFGRYVITNENLRPGDVIAVEEPFSKLLLPEHRYKYCAHCLSDNFMDLVACPGCTSTMFCSEECREIGTRKFHKYECTVIDRLNTLSTKILRIAVRTFFEALHVCGGSLKELQTLVAENDPMCCIFDFEFPLKPREVLQAVDALASNETARTQSDLFQRAGTVAIIANLFMKETALKDLLTSDSDVDFFYSFIFKQTQIAASNYHGLYNGVLRNEEVELNPQYGSGSFPFCSLMNHSCAPNVVRVSFEGKNVVMINRPIAVGEQIFDNYGYHHCLEDFQQRQTSLYNQYMFRCGCEACNNKFSLFPELPHVDNKFDRFLGDDVKKLSELDVQRAKEKFKSYCSYLQKLDKRYPCWEISSVQECLLRCFTIFTMSEFKLKLCDK
jgi:SET and MYND domain-containing protein 4